jgi:hypothetical protein
MPRITCPTCGATLDVTPDMIGETVECGGCQAQFVAQERRPLSRRADEDRPSRRRPEDDEDDRPSRRRPRDEDEDEDDYRPRRRRRRPATQAGTGMATTSLVLGILSLPLGFCCGLFSLPVSILGLVFGGLGLKTEGRSMAITGMVLSGLGLAMAIIMVVVGVAFNMANLVGRGNNLGPRPNNPPPWQQPPQAPQPPRFR